MNIKDLRYDLHRFTRILSSSRLWNDPWLLLSMMVKASESKSRMRCLLMEGNAFIQIMVIGLLLTDRTIKAQLHYSILKQLPFEEQNMTWCDINFYLV